MRVDRKVGSRRSDGGGSRRGYYYMPKQRKYLNHHVLRRGRGGNVGRSRRLNRRCGMKRRHAGEVSKLALHKPSRKTVTRPIIIATDQKISRYLPACVVPGARPTRRRVRAALSRIPGALPVTTLGRRGAGGVIGEKYLDYIRQWRVLMASVMATHGTFQPSKTQAQTAVRESFYQRSLPLNTGRFRC